MRGRGSRIFLIPGYPVNGVPPCSPEWDRLWSAATDLGMTPMLHVGFERSAFDPGWSNLGTGIGVMPRSQAPAQSRSHSGLHGGTPPTG